MKRHLRKPAEHFDPPGRKRADKAPLRRLRGPVSAVMDEGDELPVLKPLRRNRADSGAGREIPHGHSATHSIVRRFLASRADQPWDKVWREVCQAYPAGHPVRDMIRNEVDRAVKDENGHLIVLSIIGPYPLSDSHPRLVIDERGILRHHAA